jgi:hypothetical protein
MLKDRYGNEVSTNDPSIIGAIDHFTKELLKIGKGAIDVIECAKQAPQSALLQIYAATICLYGQTEELSLKAKDFLDRASLLLSQANVNQSLPSPHTKSQQR